MIAVVQHRTFLICIALLAVSAAFNPIGRREVAAQTAPATQPPAPPRGSLDELLTSFKWRSIGPDRGGRSIAVSGVKGRPREAYFGATGGGLWKTTDGGAALGAGHRRPDQELVGRRRRRLRIVTRHRLHRHGRVVHPRQHHARRRRLQVDRRRQDLDARRLLGFGRDLEDPHPSDQSRHRASSPTSAATARTATSAASSRATDGGKTWKKVLFRNAKTGAVDVAIDRQQPERDVRRAVGGVPPRVPDVERRPRQRPLQVDRRRRHLARDHAQPRTAAGLVGKISIAISGADSNRVYALVENENGGLFSSDDAGATWKLVNAGRNIRQRAFYYTHVFADPNNKDTSTR